MWITLGNIIDGKAIAAKIKAEIKKEAEAYKNERGIPPKLSVILVGDNPASQAYVRGKERACAEVGIASETLRFPSNTEEKRLVKEVERLNKDKTVHGILVQLPLPQGIDAHNVLETVSVEKDVDGLHPYNMGKLFKNENPMFIPCTPQGAIELILSTGAEIRGKKAVIIGRSNLVGKPTSMLLLYRHATVTICHTRTVNLPDITREADILVAAAGRPRTITKDMVKPGAIVIDVGISRTDSGLVGDVDFEDVKDRAGFITPVPKGVGPMTVAMLLKNTLKAAQATS